MRGRSGESVITDSDRQARCPSTHPVAVGALGYFCCQTEDVCVDPVKA